MRWSSAALFVAMATLPGSLLVAGSINTGSGKPRVLPDPTAPKSAGEALYIKNGCYQCHGLVGQGSVLSGPSLNPLRLNAEAFTAYVRHPKGVMPPYSSDILPAADLSQIERFIRSMPKAKPYTDIPLLAQVASTGHSSFAPAAGEAAPVAAPINGRTIYAQNCAGCHGGGREGGVGPDLRGQGEKPLAHTVNTILNPPPSMPKLFPDVLSREQVDAVAAFVRSK